MIWGKELFNTLTYLLTYRSYNKASDYKMHRQVIRTKTTTNSILLVVVFCQVVLPFTNIFIDTTILLVFSLYNIKKGTFLIGLVILFSSKSTVRFLYVQKIWTKNLFFWSIYPQMFCTLVRADLDLFSEVSTKLSLDKSIQLIFISSVHFKIELLSCEQKTVLLVYLALDVLYFDDICILFYIDSLFADSIQC